LIKLIEPREKALRPLAPTLQTYDEITRTIERATADSNAHLPSAPSAAPCAR
jgi:hypothetical protein